MSRLLMVTLAILGLIFTPILSVANDAEVLKSIEKYEVHIFSIGIGGLGACTGTILTNTDTYSTVLTCKHCLNPDFEVLVDSNKVLKISTATKEDLALVTVIGKFEGKEAAKLAKYNARVDEMVYMFGMPGLVFRFPSVGPVVLYSNNWGYARLDVMPGCSGAGLFNKDQELVGVVWGEFVEGGVGGGFFSEPTGGVKIGLFEPLYDIQAFLERIK